jgi:stringent starvation protein B
MSSPSIESNGTATRPYLIRALHEWCTDNGFTPYLAVHVDRSVQVPAEYVKNNEIVLNVGFEATSGLKIGNDFVEFKARFGGVAREIIVPVDHVVAIYARENGQGMAFPAPSGQGVASESSQAPRGPVAMTGGPHLSVVDDRADPGPAKAADDGHEPSPPSGPRPALKRIK